MRRCRIPGDNIVRLLHGIAFHPATHQQSSKSNHSVISLGDTRSTLIITFCSEKA